MSAYQSSRGFEANRLGLVIALVLTVVAIATGTWVLGSEPEDTGVTPVVAELGAPERARPPLAVAPPPDPAADRASRKAERRSQH